MRRLQINLSATFLLPNGDQCGRLTTITFLPLEGTVTATSVEALVRGIQAKVDDWQKQAQELYNERQTPLDTLRRITQYKPRKT